MISPFTQVNKPGNTLESSLSFYTLYPDCHQNLLSLTLKYIQNCLFLCSPPPYFKPSASLMLSTWNSLPLVSLLPISFYYGLFAKSIRKIFKNMNLTTSLFCLRPSNILSEKVCRPRMKSKALTQAHKAFMIQILSASTTSSYMTLPIVPDTPVTLYFSNMSSSFLPSCSWTSYSLCLEHFSSRSANGWPFIVWILAQMSPPQRAIPLPTNQK